MRLILAALLLSSVAHAQDWGREIHAQICGMSLQESMNRLRALSAERVPVLYFDTRDLRALRQDVSLRLRLRADRGEVTLKWRGGGNSVPNGADCELDVYRDRAIPSCSWDIDVDRSDAIKVFNGTASIDKLMSGQQKKMFNQLMGFSALGYVVPHGPATMERMEIAGDSFGRKWRLEAWEIAGVTLYEVSYREKASRSVEDARADVDQFLQNLGIPRCKQDIPKTDLVLHTLPSP